MRSLTPLRLFGAATLLSVSTLAAVAQTTPPAPSSPPAETAPMNKPEATTPAPQTTAPTPAPQNPRVTSKNEKHPLVGRNALSSDGSNMGDVRAVKTGPDGRVAAIHIKVGGFLGFGGKIVEVPAAKFTEKGNTIQLGFTSDELSNLPEVKDAS
jgi:PRC-barrel domain